MSGQCSRDKANGRQLEPLRQAEQFLRAIFDDEDAITFRPIETWIENGRKRSRVDYGQTKCTSLPLLLKGWLPRFLRTSEETNCNAFFGVAPRFRQANGFDEQWQIRKLNCLWSDVDGCSVDEAIERCRKATLPEPSIVVSSGNGAHLYWLLRDPYLVDDVDEPPQIKNDWYEKGKPPNKYYVEHERLFDDEGNLTPPKAEVRRFIVRKGRRLTANIPELSPKAILYQDVLKGIANSIRGDHTTDLSRLLRIPGTLNRKDGRNGKKPKPCSLVRIDESLKYDFAVFEHLANSSPDKVQREKLARVNLPEVRKRPTTKQSGDLSSHVLACDVAPAGTRSEIDFSLCCWAIGKGIDQEQVWAECQNAGKFGERGRDYFDLTWRKAENQVRMDLLDKAEKQVTRDTELIAASDTENTTVITIFPEGQSVAQTMTEITNVLTASGKVYMRSGTPVMIDSNDLLAIHGGNLSGVVNAFAEVKKKTCQKEGVKTEKVPLPKAYADTWLNHPEARKPFLEILVYSRNPIYDANWRLAKPGFDEDSGIYYAGPSIEPSHSQKHLDELLSEFHFSEPADRTNYIGFLLTAILANKFIGSKPMGLFTANQPGLGKTLLAQIVAIVRDGSKVPTATFNPRDEEFEKRIASLIRSGLTTIIIDNAKVASRIESPCLERCITDEVLSFRLLSTNTDITAENSHAFCLTANSPNISRDILTRSLPINLEYEGDARKLKFNNLDPEGYAQQYRDEILAELLGMVERWKSAGMPKGDYPSRFNKRRWGHIVGGILDEVGQPDFLANTKEIEAFDFVREDVTEIVAYLAANPHTSCFAKTLFEDVVLPNELLKFEMASASSIRGKATRLGIVLSRFINERFEIDGTSYVLGKRSHAKGNTYVATADERYDP